MADRALGAEPMRGDVCCHDAECSLATMDHPGGDAASPRSLAALVAVAHLAHDVPDAAPAEVAAAASYVDESLAAMPDVTRAGVHVASAAAYVGLSVIGRAPYRRQSPQQQSQGAQTLGRIALPVIGEFNRLTRGLGLVGVYEARANRSRVPEQPARGGHR